MSISRTMLRALACVALQKQADDDVSPTIADDRVFDSRLDPLTFEQNGEEIPAIIVYTDDDEGILQNRGSATGPYLRSVDLRVEIVVGMFESTIGDDKQPSVEFIVPTTDPELELKLDLFEAQVRWALTSIPNRAYTNAFLQYVTRIETIQSFAQRDESGNNKFAARRIHFRCVVHDDCPPSVEALAPGATPSPLAKIDTSKFPSPWLRDVLLVMSSTPSMKNVIDVLTGSGNPYGYAPLLKRIGINVDAIGPEADPNLLAAKGLSHGPDGRIEVEKLWNAP